MRYDAIWINNVFLGIVYKKGSFIPLGIKFCSTKRHPITAYNDNLPSWQSWGQESQQQ